MEEFQEADVLWPDNHRRRDDAPGHQRQQQQQQHSGRNASRGGGAAPPGGSSAPVGIPVIRTTTASEHEAASWAPRSHGCMAAAAFVPPHELAAATARRWSEERAAFSVCVGHGRTLKGRDLRYVRTAVLRMTGFLET
ncbi:hypothetical protein E2562_015600 [Oryza meyeriana var. granulata]|uniref:Uncharacterized protein n=1 Tax=Oryza meyeriana var. granulata TaxID=110450 RepID=A0A6G1EL87_9ORYZ|nr:hypothetical protein E2562_015600 [Oryza meyeriana var. granulata]